MNFGDVEEDMVRDCSTCRHCDSEFAYCKAVKKRYLYNKNVFNKKRHYNTEALGSGHKGSGCKFWSYKPKGFWSRIGNVGWLIVDFAALKLAKK